MAEVALALVGAVLEHPTGNNVAAHAARRVAVAVMTREGATFAKTWEAAGQLAKAPMVLNKGLSVVGAIQGVDRAINGADGADHRCPSRVRIGYQWRLSNWWCVFSCE